MTPDNYSEIEWIQSIFKRQFALDGKLTIQPIFYKNFIISYKSSSGSKGTLRVYKYHTAIDYLAPYNEESVFTETNSDYKRYSLVYFNNVFGFIFKMAGSSAVYRYSVITMT